MSFSNSLLESTEKRSNDTLIQPNRKDSISLSDAVIFYLNVLFGVGLAQNGRNMRAGIIVCSVCNISTALILYYSSWMMLTIMNHYKVLSFEEAWAKIIGPKTTIFPALGIIIPCLGNISYYFLFLRSFWKFFITNLLPDCPSYIYDTYMICTVLLSTVFPYFFFSTSFNYEKIISKMSLVCTFILYLYFCFLVIVNTKKYGFDPRHEVKAFNFKENYYQCFIDHYATYFQFFFLFLPLTFMNDLTFSRAIKCLKITMFSACLVIEIFQITEYFTFFNERYDGIIFYGYESDHPATIIGQFAYFLNVICMLPSFAHPASISICNLVAKNSYIPLSLWAPITLIIFFIAAVLSTISTGLYQLLYAIVTFISCVMQFSVPAIFFIKEIIRYHQSKFHWFGIFLFFIFGFGFGLGNMFLTVQNQIQSTDVTL